MTSVARRVTAPKVRERRLRRMADRQGLRLCKSLRRDPHARGYGGFMLVEPTPYGHDIVIGGLHPHEFCWTLDDVERCLTRPVAALAV